MALAMQYAVASEGVDLKSPLIYMWEIRDHRGEVIGRYVGKAKGGDRRPRRHYKRNVDKLLQGLPYRRGNPDGYRRVHRALADATRAAHNIVVTYVRNVACHENIDTVEQHYINHYNCLAADGIGLNDSGRRQHRSITFSVTAPTAAPSDTPQATGSHTLSGTKALIEKHFSVLQPTPRSRGWAFSIGDTRVLRIEQSGPKAKIRVKFALSSRAPNPSVDILWTDSEETLVGRIEQEIKLYRERYAGDTA
jgi:hypothetical protein